MVSRGLIVEDLNYCHLRGYTSTSLMNSKTLLFPVQHSNRWRIGAKLTENSATSYSATLALPNNDCEPRLSTLLEANPDHWAVRNQFGFE